MLITNEKRYLKIPVRNKAEKTSINFYAEGKMVFDLQVNLDFENPDFYVYYDMKHLMALDVEIVNVFGKELEVTAEAVEQEISQPRPKLHFAPKIGWINDPNGMIYYEGKYHMFFQYNPVGIYWENMHWGHAVSDDLVNWEEKEIALYPDELGYMYSGSAFEDIWNVTGLKENEHNPLLLFYTAAGGSSKFTEGVPFTQCLAYSTDGGETFRKYKENPLIGNLVPYNRDPTRIVYDEEHKKFIMTFWLSEDEYVFFRSENLLNWEELSRVHVEGAIECPDLYPLYENGVRRWVFALAFGQYVIGSLDAVNGFVPETEMRVINYGATQAPQRFGGLDKIIRISWNKNIYEDQQFKSYNGTMGTACEMYLKDGSLRIKPVEEFTGKFEKDSSYSEVKADGFSAPLKPLPSLIKLQLQDEEEMEISIFGTSIKVKEDMIVTYYPLENKTIYTPYEKNTELTLITDDVGIELLVGDRYYVGIQAICDYTRSAIEFKGAGKIKYLNVNTYSQAERG